MKKNYCFYTVSLSGGKDSVALFLKLLEQEIKIHEVVVVDLGDEYEAVYDVLLYVASICLHEHIKFTVLTIPETEEYKTFVRETGQDIGMFKFLVFHHLKKNGEKGYGWCGKQRWATTIKKQLLNKYYQSLDKFVIEYVGIAADEVHRIDIEPHKNYAKAYPLIKWKMTEKDCLEYCYKHNICWMQNGIRLYDILDRVSCVHCQQKNLKELRNIRADLSDIWDDFKDWQKKIPYPYRSDGSTIQDLDERFELEELGLYKKSGKKSCKQSKADELKDYKELESILELCQFTQITMDSFIQSQTN